MHASKLSVSPGPGMLTPSSPKLLLLRNQSSENRCVLSAPTFAYSYMHIPRKHSAIYLVLKMTIRHTVVEFVFIISF